MICTWHKKSATDIYFSFHRFIAPKRISCYIYSAQVVEEFVNMQTNSTRTTSKHKYINQSALEENRNRNPKIALGGGDGGNFNGVNEMTVAYYTYGGFNY